MAKKHIQASGEKEGQLVDCPANHQCTLKGPDGEPQQHFEISRDRESVERELNVAKDRASFYSELADDAEKDDDSGAGHLRESSDEENATVQALEAELAEHDKAEKAQKKYSDYMSNKYSSGSSIGSGKKKTKKKNPKKADANMEEPVVNEGNVDSDSTADADNTLPWPEDEDEEFRDGKTWAKWSAQVSRWGASTRALSAVSDPNTDAATLEALSYHKNHRVLEYVAKHPNTHPATLTRMIETQEDGGLSSPRHTEAYTKNRKINDAKYNAMVNPNAPAHYLSVSKLQQARGSLSDIAAVAHVADRADEVPFQNYMEAVDTAQKVNGRWYLRDPHNGAKSGKNVAEERPTAKLLDAADTQAQRGNLSEVAQLKKNLTVSDPVGASYSSYADEDHLHTVVDRARTHNYSVSLSEAQAEGLPGAERYDESTWPNRVVGNEEKALIESKRAQSETARKQIVDIAGSPKAPGRVLRKLADNNDKAALAALNNPSTPKDAIVKVADKEYSKVNPDSHVEQARSQMMSRYGDEGPWGESRRRAERAQQVYETGEGTDKEKALWGKQKARVEATQRIARTDNGYNVQELTRHPDSEVRLMLSAETNHPNTLKSLLEDEDDNVRMTAVSRFRQEEYDKWAADQELRRKQRYYGTPDGQPRRVNQYAGD